MSTNFELLMKEKGISAYMISKATGVSAQTISAWRKNRYTPKQDKLEKIAKYFGVSVDYLCGTTDTRTEYEDINKAKEHIAELEENVDKYAKRIDELQTLLTQKDELIRQAQFIIGALQQDDIKDIAGRLKQLTPEQLQVFDVLLEQFLKKQKNHA